MSNKVGRSSYRQASVGLAACAGFTLPSHGRCCNTLGILLFYELGSLYLLQATDCVRIVCVAAPSVLQTKVCGLLLRSLYGGIGFFNKEDSTRKGGTVQVRTSERVIRAE